MPLLRKITVLVAGDDARLSEAARAAAARAWPDATIIIDATGREPLELAFRHDPDVLVLARDSASAETLADALVLEHGLPSVRVVVFAAMTGEVLVPA